MSKIAWFYIKKYFSSPKKEWLRFDSVFMVVGIVVSVATLTVALSIFSGYEKVLKKTILGVNSHIYIFPNAEKTLSEEKIADLKSFLTNQPEVVSFSPVIMSQAMAVKKDRIKGCLIRGIDWQQERQPTSYKRYVFAGNYRLTGKREIVIGYRLAKNLGISLGDTIKIVSTLNSKVTPLGFKPFEQNFRIIGLYKSGMFEYDNEYVFMNYEAAAGFISVKNAFTMMEVKLKDADIERADYLAYKWSNQLDYKYQISSWIDFNGSLFSLLKLEKWVIFIILSFLVLVASFNVVSSVSTSIIEKRQELGILKAFGTSGGILKQIFLGKTFLISFLAITTGQVLGILLAYILSWQTIFLLKGDVYFLDKINVNFRFSDWLVILVVSLLIVVLASTIPLKKINKLRITEILRK